jgi:hypothetical protein
MMKHILQITTPFGKTLILVIPLLCILLIAGEIIIREPLIYSQLNTPSLNSRHLHLERQWHRLETLTGSGIQIDCFALGNSMILNGFDPQVFSQNFQSESGIELTCFNFGVDALTPVSAAALAEILTKTYQPKLLIFGTDARDFAIARDSEETSVIANMAWVQYRLGHFSLEGWLIDHSYLYRYRRTLVDLLHLKMQNTNYMRYSNGFEPLDTTIAIRNPPDPDEDSFHIQYYYRILHKYNVEWENREALMKLLEQKVHGTAIVVVEMPVPDTYFYFFDHPVNDYKAFMDTITTITSYSQVLLIETTRHKIIPDDGWADYSHTNRKGASLFSEWLGQELGKAYFEGKISAPDSIQQ